MTPFRRQAGDSKLGCVIWLLLLALGVMILWEAVPAKVRSAEFYDYLDDQAKFSQRLKAEDLRKRIMRRSRELEIPLLKDDLTVRRAGGRVYIECEYTIPLEFPFYTYHWTFRHKIDEPVFIF